MDCPRELDLLIRARYPIIYLRTSEESRACNLIANIARAEKKSLVEWSSTEGLRKIEDFQGAGRRASNPSPRPRATPRASRSPRSRRSSRRPAARST